MSDEPIWSTQQIFSQTAKAVVKLTEVQDSLRRNNERLHSLLNESRVQHREQILTLKSTMLKRVQRVEAVIEDGMSYLQGQINNLQNRVNLVEINNRGMASQRHDPHELFGGDNNYGPLKRTQDGKLLCKFCSKPLSYPYVMKHMDDNVCGGR